MNKLTTSLLTLSALTLSACDLEILDIFGNARYELQEGAWSFDVDQIEFSGACEDAIDDSGPFRMLGHIEYAGERRLELELDGLLLIAEQDGRSLYAEAAEQYDVPTISMTDCGEEDEADCGSEDIAPIDSGIFVILDGQIDGPEEFRGELFVETNELGETCTIQAHYHAQHHPRGGSGGGSSSAGGVPLEDTGYGPEAL